MNNDWPTRRQKSELSSGKIKKIKPLSWLLASSAEDRATTEVYHEALRSMLKLWIYEKANRRPNRFQQDSTDAQKTHKSYVAFSKMSDNGLRYLSGSMCQLLDHSEIIFQRYQHLAFNKKTLDKLLQKILLAETLFPFPNLMKSHISETAIGVDNHYWSLTHLVIK
ncbi:unnamed protein product [Lepeophtheirus salmonis]|uniref:(salmon louse) hypothetical protein n=1 Tax=Lepeophtheirus salmonis TaxID=72036 RepID=A0A7R8CPZ5_LEPSM|nr:unnamed protein product [Lepeophtheirus salmonis]CAF2853297.1 unnamed protein product [Lepeophtheirus salmonis]